LLRDDFQDSGHGGYHIGDGDGSRGSGGESAGYGAVCLFSFFGAGCHGGSAAGDNSELGGYGNVWGGGGPPRPPPRGAPTAAERLVNAELLGGRRTTTTSLPPPPPAAAAAETATATGMARSPITAAAVAVMVLPPPVTARQRWFWPCRRQLPYGVVIASFDSR
jgi:hypothetical protein